MAQDRENARARALRAARVVTLGLALVAVPACTGRSEIDTDLGDSGADSSTGRADTGTGPIDSGSPDDSGAVADSGDRADSGSSDSGSSDSGGAPIDAGTIADAGMIADGCPPFVVGGAPPATQQCCELEGFSWIKGTCLVPVPGPFVPPSMETVHLV